VRRCAHLLLPRFLMIILAKSQSLTANRPFLANRQRPIANCLSHILTRNGPNVYTFPGSVAASLRVAPGAKSRSPTVRAAWRSVSEW
jgi:hypothetical protein